MLDVAIVGGGLCGIALARSLGIAGRSVALFEARNRLGGRILSIEDRSGLRADLGATWFWPDNQPLLAGMIADLQLCDMVQHDDASSLHLKSPDEAPDRIASRSVFDGAHRLEGGMTRLVDAVAAELRSGVACLDHVLTDVCDRGDHVGLTFVRESDTVVIPTRCVVLAIPPRLLQQHVRFEPGLDKATTDTMRGTPTWMAARAKVIVAYQRAFWRDADQSGNAFASHEQAVIAEIFDACDRHGEKAALGGILALSPQQRADFSDGLPMLVDSQIRQIFSTAPDGTRQHYQDWATEPFTCSLIDHASTSIERQDTSSPLLRRAYWDGRLYLGGSETASRDAGMLEGALHAALRISRAIQRRWEGRAASEHPAAADVAESVNLIGFSRFSSWVAGQRDATLDIYRDRLDRSILAGQTEQLSQRAILDAMEDLFHKALAQLAVLDLDHSAATIEHGRSSMMSGVQQPFAEMMRQFVDDVVAFNRTWPKLSGVPYEQILAGEYLQVMLRDIAAAWQQFSLLANRLLVARANATGSDVHMNVSAAR